MRRSIALVCALACAARADSPRLDEARQAIEGVRYDEAQHLLVAALEAGESSPAALREIYRLSASTAVVLGQVNAGEQYFRRWLALEPGAVLGADVSPKLRAPFDAAKAYMGAHGSFEVTVARTGPSEASVELVSDPLAMARGVRLAASTAAIPFDAERRARLAVTTGAAHAFVLDEYGNILRELDVPAAAPIPPALARPDEPPATVLPTKQVRRSTHRTGLLAWGIPCASMLAVGSFFTLFGIYEHTQIDSIANDSKDHYLEELRRAESRRDAMVALGATFGGMGLLLLVPTTIYWVKNRTYVVSVPVVAVGQDHASVSVTGRF